MKTIKRFTASWCQPCKGLAMMLNSIEISTPIEIIDIDEQSNVAIQYGIRSVPTLIVFENGVEVKRNSGNFASTTTLREWLEN
jgi:thioredoxin-like negative regulator of GroEL